MNGNATYLLAPVLLAATTLVTENVNNCLWLRMTDGLDGSELSLNCLQVRPSCLGKTRLNLIMFTSLFEESVDISLFLSFLENISCKTKGT